jgi:Tfp pilus assembly protein PilF
MTMPDLSKPGNPLGLEPIDSSEAHVFISYSRQDIDFVSRLAHALQAQDVNIWIDKIGLQAGTPDWEQTLRDAIGQAKAVLLVASESSRRSRYVRDELAIAEMHNTPVYPVWAAGNKWIEAIPMGMGRVQFIDARADKFENAVQEAVRALKGLLPNTAVEMNPHASSAGAPPVELPSLRNPFKGLNAFRSEDRADFFGRDTLIQEMADALKTYPAFLAVIGASGSGKSSVVMAGLLPQLQEGASPGSRNWIYLTPFTPTDQPLERLTEILGQKLPAKSSAAIRDDLVHPSALGVYRLARQIANLDSDIRVVLYIDQFEEVFTQVHDEDIRAQFIHLLTTGVSEPNSPLTIILTMRADFYDRPLAYEVLASLIQDHQILVQPMSLAELNAAVTQPAAAVGLTFDEGLIADLVYEVRDQPGALPLLQFTLDQLYQRRVDRHLARAAYEAIGRVKGALANHAEATYNQLPSDEHHLLARSLLLRLLDPGLTELDTTRRRARLSELTLANPAQMSMMREVLDTFVHNRLLITDRRNDIETVEISHEALIREWPRLREWLNTMRSDIELQQLLSSDTDDWIKRGRAVDRLYRGSALNEAYEWSLRNLPSADEIAFIEASRSEEDRLKLAEERRQQVVRRFQTAAIFLLFVVVGVIAFSAFQQSQANKQLADQNLTVVAVNEHLNAAIATQSQFVVSADNYRQQGITYLIDERYAEAIAEFTRLIAVDEPRVKNFLYRAVANMAMKEYTAAENDYKAALNLNPKDAGILNDYGVALAAQGDWDTALEAYQNALSVSPNQIQTLTNIGVIYAAQRHFDKAETQYQQVLNTLPDFVPARANSFALNILRNNTLRFFRPFFSNLTFCDELPNSISGPRNCNQLVLRDGAFVKADIDSRVAVISERGGADVYIHSEGGWVRERNLDATEVDMVELGMDDRLVTSASTLAYSIVSLVDQPQEPLSSDCYAFSIGPYNTNVRAEPDLSSPKVAATKSHHSFVIRESSLNATDGYVWLHIVLPNGGEGWTRSEFYGWYGSCQKVGLPDNLLLSPIVNAGQLSGFTLGTGISSSSSSHSWNFAAQTGEPVHAARISGIVARIYICTACTADKPNFASQGIDLSDDSGFRDPAWGYGYGNAVIVRYDWNQLPAYGQQALSQIGLQDTSLQCIYGHLAEINVVVGQILIPGEQIGTVGNTGNSTGPHLELACKAVRGNDVFRPADPARPWINPDWFFSRIGAYPSRSELASQSFLQSNTDSENATPDNDATATAFFGQNGLTPVPTVTPIPTVTPSPMPFEDAGKATIGKNNGHIAIGKSAIWKFEGVPNQVISIYTDSEVDTSLHVADSGGNELASNDNDERLYHYFNSLVTVKLPEDGDINIAVTSNDELQEGEYILNIQEGEYVPLPTLTPVTIGDAQLGENRALLPTGGAQNWTFKGEPGKLYLIYVNADQFDYYYGIYEARTHNLIEMSGFDVYVAPSDGQITIEVLAERRDAGGDYVLFIQEDEPTATPVFVTLTPFISPTPSSP